MQSQLIICVILLLVFVCALRSELQDWLEAFQAALNMKDASVFSPLKGLPKQKALRKDFHRQPWPCGHEMATTLSYDKHKKGAKDSGTSDQPAEVLSFRCLSSDEADVTTCPPQGPTKSSTPPAHAELKGLPKKKALHTRHKHGPEEKGLYGDVTVPELDSEEKGAVQFLGYRMLDT